MIVSIGPRDGVGLANFPGSCKMLRVLVPLWAMLVRVTAAKSLPLRRQLQSTTVAEVIQNDLTYRTLAAAVLQAGFMETLSGAGPLTVMAPTNSALALLDDDYMTTLTNDAGFALHLANFLQFHVTEGAWASSNLTTGQMLTMLNGESINVEADNGPITLLTDSGSTAIISFPDLVADNGYVHGLNAALLPSWYAQDLVDASGAFFRSNLVSAGLEDVVRGGQMTVLVPTTEAFVSLPGDVFENMDLLAEIMKYHLIADVLPSTALTTGSLPTMEGSSVDVVVGSDGSVTFNGVPVVEANVLARNGIIHRLDAVLTPSSSAPAIPGVATPVPAATTSAPVTEPPSPPSTPAPGTTAPPSPGPTSSLPNVADRLALDEDWSTLTTALEAAGVMDALRAAGNITGFAPVNDAFSALDPELLERLFQPEWIAHLQGVLLLHATPGYFGFAELTDGLVLPMLDGETTSIQIGDTGSIFIYGPDLQPAVVIASDIIGRNGVLHKIDNVLLPANLDKDLVEVLTDMGFSSFLNLVEMANLTETLKTGLFTVLAPTQDAIAALDPSVLANLEANPTGLATLINYHLIPKLAPSLLLGNETLVTRSEQRVLVTSCPCGSGYAFNDIPTNATDILASNGLIYALEGVLTPLDATVAPTPAPSPAPTVARSPTPSPVPAPGTRDTSGVRRMGPMVATMMASSVLMAVI